MRALLSDEAQRPSHAPEKAIPVKTINYSGLEEQLKGASMFTVCAASIQGARDQEIATSVARTMRDFCESHRDRKVRLMVCSGLPLSQSPLSTLDRQIIDVLLPLEASNQLEVYLIPRLALEDAPRIAIQRSEKTVEYYASNFDQPIFDNLIDSKLYAANSTTADDWQERNKARFRRIENALSATALNTKAFRHQPGQPRDFKAMFSEIVGRPVKLRIEDPYLASSDRNRGALVDFLKKLQEIGIVVTSLTLAWKPAHPNSKLNSSEESPEDQQRDLSDRLRRVGAVGTVHMKPRISRLGHFHDRVVTATIDGEARPKTFRWDITSGIDNLMQRDRQCSVFLTINEVLRGVETP
jgi:hypothetical protein